MSKTKRDGRMFLDYLRNGQGATAICPWSTRARAGGPCAVPVSWDELPGLGGANVFDVFAAAARAQEPEPWEGYFEHRADFDGRYAERCPVRRGRIALSTPPHEIETRSEFGSARCPLP